MEIQNKNTVNKTTLKILKLEQKKKIIEKISKRRLNSLDLRKQKKN